MGRM